MAVLTRELAPATQQTPQVVAHGGGMGAVPTVALGEMLVQLALTPVTAALPALTAALGVSAGSGAWMLTAFLLPLAGCLLVAGRLGDLLGQRRVFLLGVVLFAVATVACGLARSLLPLVVARAVQGVGAALISGNNLAILTASVAPEQRGRAIGLVAMLSSLAALVGAGLGTLVVAYGDWRWLFLGALPLAAAALWRGRHLPPGEQTVRAGDVDWLGALTLVVGLTAMAMTLSHPHGTTADEIMPTFHYAMPAVAALAFAVFVVAERRARRPLIDWRPLRAPGFAAPVGVNLVLHGTMMGGMFVGPLLVQRSLGRGALAAGLLLLTVQGGSLLTALAGGWLHDRRWRAVRPAAAAVVAGALLLWAAAGGLGSYPLLLAVALLAGLGMGVLLAANNAAIMGALPEGQRGIASGMLETTRQLAHMFGVTVPVALLALAASGAAGGDGPAAVRTGFVWSSVAMGLIALLGVLLALVPPRRA